jgi:F0F1-type ATP synthase membrane subunit c/vacuolar-type H+-ATPase subunit K
MMAFLTSKVGIYLGIALLVAAVLGLAYCKGQSAGKSGEVVKEQKRTIQTQQEVGAANENASTARVADATKAVQQERELKDALNASNDPSRQRVLRGCLIMRQQGRNPKDLPVACGPTAGR